MLSAEPAVSRTVQTVSGSQRLIPQNPAVEVRKSLPHRDSKSPVIRAALLQQDSPVFLSDKCRRKIPETDRADGTGRTGKDTHSCSPMPKHSLLKIMSSS